jgi:hypothetical protein
MGKGGHGSVPNSPVAGAGGGGLGDSPRSGTDSKKKGKMRYVKFSNDDDDDDDDNDNNDSDRNPLVANAVSSHRQIDVEKNGSLSEEELARRQRPTHGSFSEIWCDRDVARSVLRVSQEQRKHERRWFRGSIIIK